VTGSGTSQNTVEIAEGLSIGPAVSGESSPLPLFCGPCVIEDRDLTLRMAESISEIASRVGLPLVFKASFDKANRTSESSFRGPGLDAGLEILAEVKSSLGLPVVSDIHSIEQVSAASEVLDVIQIPAFLCRQTDLLVAARESGRPVIVKKGQFMAPEDMEHVLKKSGPMSLLCERGSVFGYRTLVVDFAAFPILRSFGAPLVFDASHSVQIMGGANGVSAGRKESIPTLCRAAVAAGIDALFIEAHPSPKDAKSDANTVFPISGLEELLTSLIEIRSKSQAC